MRFVLPIAVVVCLAALLVIAPHVEPRRLRAKARRVTEDLRAKHGFREGSKASWSEARATDWPPFQYGKHQRIEGELIGSLHGLPVRVAEYETVSSGWRHHYGVAAVVLPRPVEWMEVRGEKPFSAARVTEHVPDGRIPSLGVPEFDAVWAVYADTPVAVLTIGGAATVEAMLAVPTPLSWRTHNRELLLWKRDGWTSATELLTSVSIVMNFLGLSSFDGADVNL
jgi:hypothetical protein